MKATWLPGDRAFVLHDTYGFPIEVTQEICAERDITVDEEGFARCMEEQRSRARAANADDAEAAWSNFGGIYVELLEKLGPTSFVGYDTLECGAIVNALICDGEVAERLEAGQEGEIILSTTPFYAEMGGEVGDTGIIFAGESVARVLDTKAPEAGLTVHKVKIESGSFSVGEGSYGFGRCEAPRVHRAQSHLHAHPACGIARGTRCACEAGG